MHKKSHYTVSSRAFVGLLRLGVPGKREIICLKVWRRNACRSMQVFIRRVEQILISSEVHNGKRLFAGPLCFENLSRCSSRKLWWRWNFHLGCHKTAVHLPWSKYLPWYHYLVVHLSPFVSVPLPDQCHSQCILKHSDFICFLLNISEHVYYSLNCDGWYGCIKWESHDPFIIRQLRYHFALYLSWRCVFIFSN